MSDALRLLFELDVDSRRGVAGLLVWRRGVVAAVEATRRALTQPLTLPPIKPPTIPGPVGGRGQADAHVKEFRRIEAEQKRSTQNQEREQRRLNNAVQSLQRQRSAAIIAGWKAEERAAAASLKAQERAAQQASRSIANAFRSIGPGLQSIGRTLTIGITAPLLALGAASLKSAKDIDANVNTLKAFTGSAEAAERRLAELIKTSRETPGLTTKLGLTLDAQLRVARTTQETIDRVLPAIGRLNAVQRLDDPANFVRNLGQLVTQNFERSDLKELVGQSPIAGQIIAELFKVDSPTNAKAIREAAQKMGITTTDAFFTAFAAAASRNQALATVTESIATRLDKIVDRVQIALRPLGLAIINVIEPFIEPVSKLIEQIGDAFNSLSAPVKTAIIVIAGIAAAAGPLLLVLGGLATAITAVVAALGTVASVVAAVGLPAIAAAVGGIVIIIGEWVAILVALGLAWKTNFLNIRELVTDAAGAVLQAFQRIRTIIGELTQRILPTLQSITSKVLGVLTVIWERYGKDVIETVGQAFTFVIRVIETFVTVFGNIVDLLLKLIDGDFKGAWAAFARIVLAAVDAFDEAINKIPGILVRAFVRINIFLAEQAGRFLAAGQVLAVALVSGIVTSLVSSAPKIRDAIVEMFTLAAEGFDPASIAAIVVARFVAALRRAASEGIPVSVNVVPQDNLQRIELNPDGTVKGKKGPSDGGKGADQETRRRIRLLELEAERAEAIARQRINAENIRFEQRRISLKEFTDFQIAEEQIVLDKKRAVFAAERAEAAKLGKGRDLALGEIRLKELRAEIEFADKRNQVFANQEREETEAAKAHRQAILDIQDESGRKQLELVDSYVERYLLSFEDAEKRRIAIEEKARERRRSELEIQLGEAGENVEEQQRIKDAIAKLDAESATSKEESENRKRRALRATIEAEQDYYENLHQITRRATQLLRDAADIELERLVRKFGDRRRFRLRALELEREANEREHQERLRQLEQEKKDAEKRLEGVRDAEEKLRNLRAYYRDLERAENERRQQERKKEEDDERRERDPFSPLKSFLDRFKDAIKNANDAIAESVQNMSQSVVNAAQDMVGALQQGIVAWILYGESLGKALKQALAQQLATLSAEFAIQALKHAAYALGSLAFGNFAGAAKHAAAAAAFTAAAAATGFAARSLAKSSGMLNRGSNAGTASAAVSGGQPQNREFQYGGNAVEPSSIAARDGSAAARTGIVGSIAGLVEQVNLWRQEQVAQTAKLDSTLSRIASLPAGDVVAIGATQRPDAVGIAVLQHSKENNDFNRDMATNMGF